MWMNIILVGSGSMLGGISRYLFSGMIKHLIPVTFPLGTFLVNIIGLIATGIGYLICQK